MPPREMIGATVEPPLDEDEFAGAFADLDPEPLRPRAVDAEPDDCEPEREARFDPSAEPGAEAEALRPDLAEAARLDESPSLLRSARADETI
jgi:hypothetical protein